MSYDDVMATKGTRDDKYTRSKSAVFAMLYGGEAYTLMTRLGVAIEDADAAYRRFTGRYRKVGEERRKVFEMFCSMTQSGGLGSKVEWREPADYVESIFGFRRYFTLENAICKALYELAESPPQHWHDLARIKVVRRDREQTAVGAVCSALFGAAFQIQAGNMRAAANHVIQSAGATVTKHLQRRIWDLQPPGVHGFVVLPMNVHDEVLAPTKPEYVARLNRVVHETVESYRERVPLIGIDWGDDLTSWADK
jgi:DNA polymerase I-like protein with 3'-5' exonuclease and polymerase domains